MCLLGGRMLVRPVGTGGGIIVGMFAGVVVVVPLVLLIIAAGMVVPWAVMWPIARITERSVAPNCPRRNGRSVRPNARRRWKNGAMPAMLMRRVSRRL